MKKNAILISLLIIIVIVLCSCSYYFNNISNIIEKTISSSDVIVSPNINPSFTALRFEDIKEKGTSGIPNISPKKLEEMLKYFHENNYNFLTSKDIYEAIDKKSNLPPNSVWLTFDGGLKSTKSKVTSLLKKYKAHATAFIPISFIREPYRLTNLDLEEMAKSGVWDIQTQGSTGGLDFFIDKGETKGNFYLNRLWQIDSPETYSEYKLRIVKDLKDSIKYIKDKFNQDVYFFAYSFYSNINEYNDQVLIKNLRQSISSLGLMAVSNYEPDFITNDLDIDKYNIPRLNVYEYNDPNTLFSLTYTGKRLKFKNHNDFVQLKNINYNNLVAFDSKCYVKIDKNLDVVSNYVYMPDNLSSEGYEILNIENNKIYTQTKLNSNYYLNICDLNFNPINKIELSQKAVGVFSSDDETYILDVNNSIYKLNNTLEKCYDTNLLCNPDSLCFNDKYIYITDNSQKRLYIYDFYSKKLKDTKRHTNNNLSLCYLGNYGIVAYERNYDVFVSVIPIEEY